MTPPRRTMRQRAQDLAAEMNDLAALLAAELERLGAQDEGEAVERMRVGLLLPLEQSLGPERAPR